MTSVMRKVIYLDIKPFLVFPLDQKPNPQDYQSGKWQQSSPTGILVMWGKSLSSPGKKEFTRTPGFLHICKF